MGCNCLFFVIDGLDGCGKSTQMDLVKKHFSHNNLPYKVIKLPDYESPSSSLVKMYLNGQFGDKPTDVNAYAATAFFAVDRYANFATKWKKDYENGVHIIADRYTTSNALHQASKLDDEKTDSFLDWLWDFEYNKLGLPKPDCVIFLDMPVEVSQRLMTGRYSGEEAKKDIHERDIDYLNHCRDRALYTADKCGWNVVRCCDENNCLKSIEEINKEILTIIDEKIN